MDKGVIIDNTVMLIIAIATLVTLIIVYIFVSGMGGEWIEGIRQAMAFNTPSP